VTLFHHFLIAKVLHFFHCTLECEFAIHIAITTVFVGLATIGSCATIVGIFTEWHATTLTEFFFSHDLEI
jgi:hypothetical protein